MAWRTAPGETPIDDLSGLKVKGLSKRRELNRHEAENIRRATVKYLSRKPSRRTASFKLSWLRKLHKEMLGDVWTWAGSFRHQDLNLGVHWTQIEVSLQRLLDDLAYWDAQEVPLLEQAARLHHRAVQIHPFLNGNGRWARLLANIWLKQHDHEPTEWPEVEIGAASNLRKNYLKAIKAADQGDEAPLRALHERYTARRVQAET